MLRESTETGAADAGSAGGPGRAFERRRQLADASTARSPARCRRACQVDLQSLVSYDRLQVGKLAQPVGHFIELGVGSGRVMMRANQLFGAAGPGQRQGIFVG